MLKTILFVAPHLSTGGMPQYLLQRVRQLTKYGYTVYVAEWQCISEAYIVQRRQIARLLGDRFCTMYGDNQNLLNLIADIKPDVIHFQEIVETFLPVALLSRIYRQDAPYAIVETSHSADDNSAMKRFLPNKLFFVSEPQMEKYIHLGVPCELSEYTLDKKVRPDRTEALQRLQLDPAYRHVLNVGLFTPGKNQGEVMEIARFFLGEMVQFHFVGNQAGNFADYWQPLLRNIPSNCRIWGECDDVDAFYSAMDLLIHVSKLESTVPIVVKEALSWGMPVFLRDLPMYKGINLDSTLVTYLDSEYEESKCYPTLRRLLNLPEVSADDIARRHELSMYDGLCKRIVKDQQSHVVCTFVKGPLVLINGTADDEFNVKFINRAANKVVYETKIRTNDWARADPEYYVDWEVVVTNTRTGKVLLSGPQDLRGKRVLIDIECTGLGDSLAWFPYADEFRKKHGCEVIVSTAKNGLFEKQYPEITFVKPGTAVKNITHQYTLGWFWRDIPPNKVVPDTVKHHPADFRSRNFQRASSDILGLEFQEVRSKIAVNSSLYPARPGLVGIGLHSTMQMRYWNNPTGWLDLVAWLKAQGKTVVMMSFENDGFMGNFSPPGVERLSDYSLEHTIAAMNRMECFIGMNSGLAWLAWTLGIPTVVVDGVFDQKFFPEEVVEVHPDDSVCHSCCERVRFNIGKWDSCPGHQDTERMFECTKSISSLRVIEAVKSLQRRAV